jgi:DNA-binding IclR family transcriptional regulator
VASSNEGVDVKQISQKFGLSLATTYHLVNTLVDEGLLSRTADRRHTLGPAVGVLTDAHGRDVNLPEQFQPILREVARRTGETAYISAWRGEVVVVLASVEGSNAVRVVGLTPGFSGNLHARASGKLLLAYAPSEVRERLIAQMTLEPVTPRTIVTKAALRKELDKVVKAGVAFDVEEFQAGVACIAVPLRVAGSVVAALTISSPIARFRDSKSVLLGLVREIVPADFLEDFKE